MAPGGRVKKYHAMKGKPSTPGGNDHSINLISNGAMDETEWDLIQKYLKKKQILSNI